MWERTGQKRTEVTDLRGVVGRAMTSPFRVQSDFARENAAVVAQGASLGYITTRRPDGTFGRDWLVSRTGGSFLEEQQNGGEQEWNQSICTKGTALRS